MVLCASSLHASFTPAVSCNIPVPSIVQLPKPACLHCFWAAPGTASPLEWLCAAGGAHGVADWLHAWAAPATSARVCTAHGRPRLLL